MILRHACQESAVLQILAGSASSSSTVSKWEDIDSGRIDRLVGGEERESNGTADHHPATNGRHGGDDEEEFHEMPPASQARISLYTYLYVLYR